MKVLNFGSLNIDNVYSVENFVRAGETISSYDLNYYCGGKGLNQSIAFSRAGVKTFQPGHESCRSFYNVYVRKIITNAVHWAAPNDIAYYIPDGCPKLESCAYETKAEYLKGSPEMLAKK